MKEKLISELKNYKYYRDLVKRINKKNLSDQKFIPKLEDEIEKTNHEENQ